VGARRGGLDEDFRAGGGEDDVRPESRRQTRAGGFTVDARKSSAARARRSKLSAKGVADARNNAAVIRAQDWKAKAGTGAGYMVGINGRRPLVRRRVWLKIFAKEQVSGNVVVLASGAVLWAVQN